MDREYIDVKIMKSLYNRIVKVANDLGVKDITEFISDLIRDSLDRIESELSSEEYTPEEIEEIKNRLRSLGYLE